MTKWLPFVLCALAGCTSTPGPLTPEDLAPTARGVYVLNEGVWGQSNGSLSLFEPESGTVHQNIFSAANGRALGDVANYILVRGQHAYIILNGSDRIEVIETQRHTSRGTINLTPGLSPRQMAVINDTVGLVTNLYDASVSVINLRSLTELSRIPVGPNPEGIAIAAGTAFVANSGLGTGRSVSMIDLATMTPVGALEVADNPAEILALDGSRVMVLCAGSYGDYLDPDDDTPAAVIAIDALQRVVVDSLLIGGHAFRMATDGESNLYVPGSAAVLRIDTRSPGSVRTFVQGEYYGIGVDTLTGDVYLGDARTFSIPGEVRVFTSSGTQKAQFDVGLIPGRFAFLRQ
jgi:YVTN family beta-propeller protein